MTLASAPGYRPGELAQWDIWFPAVDVPVAGKRARSEGWALEQFLAARLEREVAARQSNGGEIRVRAARFPARKTLEDFDFDHQRSLKSDTVLHLGTLDFVAAKGNIVFLGPPGNGEDRLGHRARPTARAVAPGHPAPRTRRRTSPPYRHLWLRPWPRLGSLTTALRCRPQRDGSPTSGAGRTLFATPEHRLRGDQ